LVTVLGNSGDLKRTGYDFAGWNTQADGKGTSYTATGSDSFTIGAASVTLYAKWVIKSYSVTYSGNGNTGGAVPLDALSPHVYHSSVIVLGNSGVLVKAGYTFNGWNTAANGTGTRYAADGLANFLIGDSPVVLYAQWTANPVTNVPSVTVASVQYASGSSLLTPATLKSVKTAVLKAGKSARFYIICGVGKLRGATKAQLENLAKSRGKALRAYLHSLGVKYSSVTLIVKVYKTGKPKTELKLGSLG
jgi:hypothetical protein